jgi:hypothetical protein
MALKLDQLKKMLEKEDLHFFVHPSRPALMLAGQGLNGTYQFVISLEHEGQFFQIRTVNYLYCPDDHPNLGEVLKTLGSLNYARRLVKFGWDPEDGEIAAYADAWLMDGTLTQQQVHRMFANYLPVIDLAYSRLRLAMETGKDPGDAEPAIVIGGVGGLSGLPPVLRRLLERLMGGGKKEDEDELDEI